MEAISFARKEAEAPDVVRLIEETKRHSRCKWKDFGILYRSHIQRDEVVQELTEHEIPFTIESMDVSDTPEVRDLFACVEVVVDLGPMPVCFEWRHCPNSPSIPNNCEPRYERLRRTRKKD